MASEAKRARRRAARARARARARAAKVKRLAPSLVILLARAEAWREVDKLAARARMFARWDRGEVTATTGDRWTLLFMTSSVELVARWDREHGNNTLRVQGASGLTARGTGVL